MEFFDQAFHSEDLGSFMLIALCLVASAFFSASETAITSINHLKAKHLLDQNGEKVSQLKLWLEHPSRVLTTILIFNNLANILASVLATELTTKYFKSQAVGIATGSITLLVLVFGEIIPKSFARANSESIALISMSVINVIYKIFYPIIYAFSEFAKIIIKKLGSQEELTPTITEEELEFFIEVGEQTGAIENSKKDMLSGIFDMDETKAREVLTPRTDLIAVEKQESLEDTIKIVLQSGHSRLPVYEDRIDNICGIIFAKDLLRLMSDPKKAKDNIEVSLSDIMREPIFVPESKSLLEIFKELKRTKNHMAIVVDEYGGTAGLVTMEDIIEEIVGDIQDEFDAEEASILKIDATTFDVAGSVNITDFMEHFDLEDEYEKDSENEADTIGGWMTHLLGDLPEVGQTITYRNLDLEVIETERHRIERIRVIFNPEEKKEEK